MTEPTDGRAASRRGLVLSIPAAAQFLGWVRSATRSAGDALGVSSSSLIDLTLVVNELLTNAIDNGAGERVRLELSVAGGEVTVRASNEDGGGLIAPPQTWSMPAPASASGRGLGIVRQLCDSVDVSNQDGWVSVECRLAMTGR